MRTATKILIFSIVLPALAYIAIYYIAKSEKCQANCTNKKCGQSDGCSGVCKLCPKGLVCDGKKCSSSTETYKTINPKGKIKGICYFDIDNTLTTAEGNPDEIMQECLKNDFAVGIITASARTVNHICSGDKVREPWMSDILCKQFQENDSKMYNSTTVIAGQKKFPPNYPFGQNQGYIKGYNMKYGRDSYYPHVPDKCVVLFDDQQPVIDGVKNFGKELETQCSNTSCHYGRPLNLDTVKAKIKEMKANGCI